MLKDLLEHVTDPGRGGARGPPGAAPRRAGVRLLARRPALGLGRLHPPAPVHAQELPAAVRRSGLRSRAGRIRVGDARHGNRLGLDHGPTGVRVHSPRPRGCPWSAATCGCSRAAERGCPVASAFSTQSPKGFAQPDRGVHRAGRDRQAIAACRTPAGQPALGHAPGCCPRRRPAPTTSASTNRARGACTVRSTPKRRSRNPRAKPASQRCRGESTPTLGTAEVHPAGTGRGSRVPTRQPKPQGQVDVLAVGDQALVETTHALERATPVGGRAAAGAEQLSGSSSGSTGVAGDCRRPESDRARSRRRPPLRCAGSTSCPQPSPPRGLAAVR